MNKVLAFLRDKAFVLVLLACIVGAAFTSVWAIRTVRDRLSENPGTADSDIAGIEEYPGLEQEEGDAQWQQPGVGVAGNVEGVPKPTPAAPAQSSASRSGSGSSSASANAEHEQEEPAAVQAPSYTSPVSGRILTAFSGDDLVYNKTLEDWRTHNGVDYACDAGESVYAPVSGTVAKAAADGNWGGVVEITAADGSVWRVCGVTDAVVKAGDAVSCGQQLGRAGAIGCESLTGSHVHLEIRKNGRYIDPAEYLG